MPSFSSTQAALRSEGPLVSLQIVPPQALVQALQASGDPVPQPISATALIDTGASQTSIETGTAAKLGLQPTGIVNVNTPNSTNVACEAYTVGLIFPNGVGIDGITVIELPLQGQNIECLLGRDVLSQAVLTYVGFSNTFTLSF